jgi:hypothetical protein
LSIFEYKRVKLILFKELLLGKKKNECKSKKLEFIGYGTSFLEKER